MADFSNYDLVYDQLQEKILEIDPLAVLVPKPRFPDLTDISYLLSVLFLVTESGSFTLTNGKGTTANGTAVDLGGNISSSTTINGTTDGTNRFPILWNAFNSFRVFVNSTASSASAIFGGFMTGSTARMDTFVQNSGGDVSGSISMSTTGTKLYAGINKKGHQYVSSTDLSLIDWFADNLSVPSIQMIRENHRSTFFSVFSKNVTYLMNASNTTFVLTTGVTDSDLVTNISEGHSDFGHIHADTNRFLVTWTGRKISLKIRVTLTLLFTSGASFQAVLRLRRVVDNVTIGQIFLYNAGNSGTELISETFESHVYSATDPFCVDGFYIDVVQRNATVNTITNVNFHIVSSY